MAAVSSEVWQDQFWCQIEVGTFDHAGEDAVKEDPVEGSPIRSAGQNVYNLVTTLASNPTIQCIQFIALLALTQFLPKL